MHSGGGTKEPPYENIYIEAPEEEAIRIFFNRFDHNPTRVTCTCCGEDYSISESESLEEATEYHRTVWNKSDYSKVDSFRTIESYLEDENVLFISEAEIQDSERSGHVPSQGYVWQD